MSARQRQQRKKSEHLPRVARGQIEIAFPAILNTEDIPIVRDSDAFNSGHVLSSGRGFILRPPKGGYRQGELVFNCGDCPSFLKASANSVNRGLNKVVWLVDRIGLPADCIKIEDTSGGYITVAGFFDRETDAFSCLHGGRISHQNKRAMCYFLRS